MSELSLGKQDSNNSGNQAVSQSAITLSAVDMPTIHEQVEIVRKAIEKYDFPAACSAAKKISEYGISWHQGAEFLNSEQYDPYPILCDLIPTMSTKIHNQTKLRRALGEAVRTFFCLAFTKVGKTKGAIDQTGKGEWEKVLKNQLEPIKVKHNTEIPFRFDCNLSYDLLWSIDSNDQEIWIEFGQAITDSLLSISPGPAIKKLFKLCKKANFHADCFYSYGLFVWGAKLYKCPDEVNVLREEFEKIKDGNSDSALAASFVFNNLILSGNEEVAKRALEGLIPLAQYRGKWLSSFITLTKHHAGDWEVRYAAVDLMSQLLGSVKPELCERIKKALVDASVTEYSKPVKTLHNRLAPFIQIRRVWQGMTAEELEGILKQPENKKAELKKKHEELDNQLNSLSSSQNTGQGERAQELKAIKARVEKEIGWVESRIDHLPQLISLTLGGQSIAIDPPQQMAPASSITDPKEFVNHLKTATGSSLKLSGCSLLTDDLLGQLTDSKANVTWLDLSYCTNLTDKGLETLAALYPNVTDLNLTGCSKIKGSALPKFEHLGKLVWKDLDLDLGSLFKTAPPITALSLKYWKIKENYITNLFKNCSAIEELNIDESEALSEDLKEMRGLKVLSMQKVDELKEEDVRAFLKNNPEIRELDLARCKVNKGIAMLIAQMGPNLQKLSLDDGTFDDEALKAIAEHCPRLVSLSIRNCDNLTNNGVNALQTLPLLVLSVDRCRNLSGDLIAKLPASLEELNLAGVKVRDEHLREGLGGLPHLRTLGLSNCREVTGTGLVSLSPTLKALDLSGTAVTTSTLGGLTACSSLDSLKLAGCTNLKADVIDLLVRLKALRNLDLNHTDLKAVAENKLPPTIRLADDRSSSSIRPKLWVVPSWE